MNPTRHKSFCQIRPTIEFNEYKWHLGTRIGSKKVKVAKRKGKRKKDPKNNFPPPIFEIEQLLIIIYSLIINKN